MGKYFDRPELGLIKKGAAAGLVLLSANPLENIDNTKKIEEVMLRNLWLPKEYIVAELKKLEKK